MMTPVKVLTPMAALNRQDYINTHGEDAECSCDPNEGQLCSKCAHPGGHLKLQADGNWEEPGASWEEYSAEVRRVNLPSGGMALKVWAGCDRAARLNMMDQVRAMRDGHFDPPKNWGTW